MSERPAVTRLPGKPNQPLPPTGRPACGQIVRIHSGQSHGFIRDEDSREIFFHRTDTAWGTVLTAVSAWAGVAITRWVTGAVAG